MKILSTAKMYFPLLAILIVGLLSACGNQVLSSVPQPAKPPTTTDIPASPPVESPEVPAELPANRVEVVYFHMPQRCAKCLCFEERADYVAKTYFQEEMSSGKLTFKVCELGDKENAALILKYNAYASQLLINTIIDNADNIRDIQEIWDWHCTSDTKGFDENVRSIIAQSLEKTK